MEKEQIPNQTENNTEKDIDKEKKENAAYPGLKRKQIQKIRIFLFIVLMIIAVVLLFLKK